MSSASHVAFVGLGYIGLPTAVVMANSGLEVTGVDVNAANVEKINRGEVTIIEPGLEDELKKALDSGRFSASTEQVHADAYIIACLLYTSPSPRDATLSRMPSSA